MRRDYFSWWSPRLQMEMPILRFGHWGHPILMYPTWAANFEEAEQRGLIATIAGHIEAGRVTVYCINSINPYAWHKHDVPLHEKARLQAAYSGYVEEEVVPHIRGQLQNGSARITAAGASFGGFHATNAVFRRPDLFDGLIAMSAMFHLDWVRHGYTDDNIYFNSPLWFVPRMEEGHALNLLRHHTRIQLLTGQGQWEYPEESRRFSEVLHHKGIGHQLDLWGHDQAHDWPTWQRMLEIVVSERMGF